MLLNPTHQITFSGLPPDVLDAYVRYKKGTRALVTWFLQNSPSPDRKVKRLPIKELESLAQSVSQKLKTIPDVVHFHFRETISARKRLSKYFRGQVDEAIDNEDTVNHEYFTTSLTRIYTDLCACCGHPNNKHVQHKTNAGHLAPLLDRPINHYSNLTVEDAVDDELENDSIAPLDWPECASSAATFGNGPYHGLSLADDGFSRVLEVVGAVQLIENICRSVEQYWCLAGSGEASFVVASFITNVAFASIRQVGIELLEHEEDLSFSVLHRLCHSFHHRRGPAYPDPNSRIPVDLFLDRLRKTEEYLLCCRDEHRSATIQSCRSCIQKAEDCIRSSAVERAPIEHNFMTTLIDNIAHLVTNTVIPTSIVKNSSPIYADVGYIVTRPAESSRSWSAVLGLHLLEHGYKAYLRSVPLPNAVSKCRISALRLAQQAAHRVSAVLNDKACFPCRCSQTLAFHLQNLEEDLCSYTKHKCWDLYFQSPWVAGNHALEILDLCHYYGMRLFNYRYYVGAVLHSYNVLNLLAGLEEIPILESLCDQFRDVFFPGGSRPKINFRACWGRYAGARLRFKKGHRSRNSKNNFCMAIPAYAVRRAAGLGSNCDQMHPKTNCLLFNIKQNDYHVSEDIWDRLGNPPTSQDARNHAPKKRNSSRAAHCFSSPNLAPRLGDLYQDVRISFVQADPNFLPSTLLNLFAVFEDCVRVVSKLSDAEHTEVREQGINCICFASTILSSGDRIVDGRRLGRAEAWKKEDHKCISEAKSMILEVFGRINREQWLWRV